MKNLTLDEARKLLTQRAEDYEAAKAKVEDLVKNDKQGGVPYQIADAERMRAWSLLSEAQSIFVNADRDDDGW